MSTDAVPPQPGKCRRATRSQRTGRGAYLLLVALVGCASSERLDPGQEAIAADHSVVAFSVDTSKLHADESWARPVQIHLRFGEEAASIDLTERKDGLQRVVLEVRGQALLIDQFELEAGTGIFWSRFGTLLGEELSLTPGEINYLGRLAIEDIRFEQPEDGSRPLPIGVRLAFTDALADDLPAWEPRYRVFRDRAPDRKIVGSLSEQDYLALWARDESNVYDASRIFRRASDGAGLDTPRGPIADPSPR